MALATTIHLVRHGDVENPKRLYYGRLPGFPLNERGRGQARAAAEVLSKSPIAVIYSSPQQRAQDTARLIQAGFDPAPELIREPAINEIRSQFDGATQDEMEQRAWNFYRDIGSEFEQPSDVLARMRSFMQRVRQDHEGEEVVAVSHADPIVFVWMWVLGIPLQAENRRLLDRHGLADDYPAKASISTFRFETQEEEEHPDYDYTRPY